MPQKCRVCHSPYRMTIDEELLKGASLSFLAESYNLHVSALHRHRKNHLVTPAVDALRQRQETHQTFGLTVLGKLDELVSDLRAEKDKAKQTGNAAIVMAASKELREVYKLQAQLTHQLATSPTTNILITASPAWAEIKRIVTTSLKPYPDALQAVRSNLRAYLPPPQDNGHD